jgi:hypothetical protein
MNGSKWSLVTISEFKSPINIPHTMTMGIANHIDIPMDNSRVANTPENAATEPGERSTCPDIRRNPSPIATRPTIDDAIMMFLILLAVKKLLSVKKEKMTTRTPRASNNPIFSDFNT